LENVVVKRVNDLNLNDIYPLVLESEREGFRFLRRFYDDYTSGTNRFDREGEALFVAQVSSQLVGICGLNQDPYLRDSKVGRIRRLYVHPNFRKQGVGKLLVANVIEEAKRTYKTLTLRTDNPIADRFYKSIGFSTDHLYENATHFRPLDGDLD
jgi:ribosomal protein S18 acetylase RimI-like enzyme